MEPTIGFTNEQENSDALPFLGIWFMNISNKLEFIDHHNSTNKNDYI